MNCSTEKIFTVGARNSLLSYAQVAEVLQELHIHHPHVRFHPLWIETKGDKDLKTSLKTLDKTDFFTYEIDQMQSAGLFRLSIHSAKDLPDPLAPGLKLIALTKGVDPSDVLVLREKENLHNLPLGAKIGTSSIRREEAVRALRSDLMTVDIRGAIPARLALLDRKEVDGVVIAQAALIRLGLTDRNRIVLKAESAPLQGKLAVIAREEDEEMQTLFCCIDERRR